jgi:hypothetical protein
VERARGWTIPIVVAALIAAAALFSGCGSGEATGKASEEDVELALVAIQEDALRQYRVEVVREAASLLAISKQMARQGSSGEVPAEPEQKLARNAYGHLQPAARLLPKLNERVNEAEAERSRRLVADVERLRDALAVVKIHPERLAEENAELLRDVLSLQIEGKEDPVAGVDLMDAAAEVEGAESAFQAYRPRLTRIDPALAIELEADFVKAFEMLAFHGRPARQSRTPDPAMGTYFVPDLDLEAFEVEEIAEPLELLDEVLQEAADALANS